MEETWESAVLRSVTTVRTSFKLFDAHDTLIAIATDLKLLSRTIELKSDDATVVASAYMSVDKRFDEVLCSAGEIAIQVPDTSHLRVVMYFFEGLALARRNSDGTLMRPVCNSLYLFLVIGLPVVGGVVSVAAAAYCVSRCRKRLR